MDKKTHIVIFAALLLFTIIIVLAYAAINKPPTIAALRDNPSLFNAGDYQNKIALHTRLTTLFPRGTPRENIEQFFQSANIEGILGDSAQCTYHLDYEEMRFILGLNDNALRSVHILEEDIYWPEQKEHCRASSPELTPVSSDTEEPIHLPLTPLDVEEP